MAAPRFDLIRVLGAMGKHKGKYSRAEIEAAATQLAAQEASAAKSAPALEERLHPSPAEEDGATALAGSGRP